MTQKDKELLIQDLCARLPYGVMCNFAGRYKLKLFAVKPSYDHCIELHCKSGIPYTCSAESIKPYLRSISSMTEEEKKEVKDYLSSIEGYSQRVIWLYDYCLSHHLDHRHLIPKGLAIAVTEENNPYKD